MQIKAKFFCVSVLHENGGAEVVTMAAAYGPENQPWSKFTPSGQLTMRIDQSGAVGQFKPGTHYFLTFDAAD